MLNQLKVKLAAATLLLALLPVATVFACPCSGEDDTKKQVDYTTTDSSGSGE